MNDEAKLKKIGAILTDMVEAQHGERIEVDFDDLAATMKRLETLQLRLDGVKERAKAANVKYVCKKCGSVQVCRDAYAAWDIEKQKWVLCAVFDQGYCEGDCGGECNLKEVSLG